MRLTEQTKKEILSTLEKKGYEEVFVNELGYWFKKYIAISQLVRLGYSEEEANKVTKTLTKKDLSKTKKLDKDA